MIKSDEMSLYKTVIDMCDTGIMIIDVHTLKVIYSNKPMDSLALSDVTKSTGCKCYEYLYNEQEQCKYCVIKQAIEYGVSQYVHEIRQCKKHYSCKLKSCRITGMDTVIVYVSDITDNIIEKHELKRSEKLLRQAIEDSNLLSWEYSFELETLTNENRILRESGFLKNPNNIPETQINDGYLAPESHELYRDMFRRMKRGEPTVCGEIWIYRNRDVNDKHCIRVSYTVDYDDGIPVSASGLGLDVTNEKNTEMLYQKQIETLMRTYPNAVGILNINLTQDKVTSQTKFLQFTPQGNDNLSISDYLNALSKSLPDNDDGKYGDYLSKNYLMNLYMNGEHQFSFTHRFLKKDSVLWINTNVRMILNPMTQDVEAYVFAVDVSQKSISEQIIQKLIDIRYDILALIYPETNYVEFNYTSIDYCEKQEISITNYNENRKATSKYYSDEQQQFYMDCTELTRIKYFLDKKGKYSFTMCRNINNCMRYKCFSYNYLTEEHAIILATVQDVTALYEKEEAHFKEVQEALNEAERANAAKTAFLSNMSHDIRTPMNAIINMAKMVAEDINTPDKALEDLKKINVSSTF